MPPVSGSKLGPYEIVAPLGAGGMGEVYRARDTRLGRDVAVKVLPEHLSASPEVRGPLPTEQQLRFGAEIADALDRAQDDWDPAFTPDGRSVIWSSNKSGHFEIWIADADGSGARRLTDDGADAENPTATKDGSWIVYNSYSPEKRGIWKIHPDGSGATRFVTGDTNLPEVSPDGALVVYPLTALGSTEAAIRVARVSDGAEVPFECETPAVGGSVPGRSRWMPDGRAIAFCGVDSLGISGVFVQDFDPTGTRTRSPQQPLAGFDPDYPTESFGISPDGSRIVLSGIETLNSVMLAEGHAGPETRDAGATEPVTR